MKSVLMGLVYGVATVLAASRTQPPAGCVHVAESRGQYTSIQAAVNSFSTTAEGTQCIFVDQGTYKEQVYVRERRARLTIYGYTANDRSAAGNRANVTFSRDAKSAGDNDKSGTLRVAAADVRVYNLNVVNSCKFSLCSLAPGKEGAGTGDASPGQEEGNRVG